MIGGSPVRARRALLAAVMVLTPVLAACGRAPGAAGGYELLSAAAGGGEARPAGPAWFQGRLLLGADGRYAFSMTDSTRREFRAGGAYRLRGAKLTLDGFAGGEAFTVAVARDAAGLTLSGSADPWTGAPFRWNYKRRG